MVALSDAGQRAAWLAIAAAVALAVWCILLVVLAVATRPDLPRPLPATSAFGGRESPAVVSLLVNRWEVGREAVPATLLDLAARKALDVDQVGMGKFVVRLRPQGVTPAELTPYEGQVLQHIRSLAVDGVVPAEALTTGPGSQSEGWWRGFQKSVVADARGQGLSRSRWSPAMLAVLGVVAVVPALLAAAAFVTAPSDSSSRQDDPVGGTLALAAFAWGGLMAIPLTLRQERDTPAGRDAAARWLGLRAWLDEDETFDAAPPAAVAIWDRYLAYGAAMGVAAGAVRALPLGSESDTEAWSSYGGGWHVARVRYPLRVPPGWGQRPIVAALKGLGVLAVGVVVGAGAGPAAARLARDVLAQNDSPWAVAGVVAAGVVGVAAALWLVRAAIMLALGVSDLFAKEEVVGQVVRHKSPYVAVDDGQSLRVRAWRVEPGRMGAAARGAVVRVTVTPRLGWVSRIEAGGQGPGVDDRQVLEGPGQGHEQEA